MSDSASPQTNRQPCQTFNTFCRQVRTGRTCPRLAGLSLPVTTIARRATYNVSCTSPLARPTLCPFMQVPLALARPPIHKPVRIFSRHRERPCRQAHIRAAIHKPVRIFSRHRERPCRQAHIRAAIHKPVHKHTTSSPPLDCRVRRINAPLSQ